MPVYHTAGHLRAASWKLSSRNELPLFIFFFLSCISSDDFDYYEKPSGQYSTGMPDVCLLLLFIVNYSVPFSMPWLGVAGGDLEGCFGLGLGHTLNNSTTQKQPPR